MQYVGLGLKAIEITDKDGPSADEATVRRGDCSNGAQGRRTVSSARIVSGPRLSSYSSLANNLHDRATAIE